MMGHLGEMHLRSANIFFAGIVHYEHISRLEELFLHAAGRNVDLVFMADTGATTGSCYLEKWVC